MAVAKSYEKFEQVGQPFERDGKMYVIVRGACPRCGGSGHYSYNQMDGTRCYGCMGSGISKQTVRWYTESQRAALDRAAERRAEQAKIKKEQRRIKFAARNAFGFGEAGYITLYRGDLEKITEFFKSFVIDEAGHRAAWFNTIFNWYTPSTITFDKPLPEGVEPIRLDWDTVRDPEDEENLSIRDDAYLTEYINKLLAVPSKSEYQGTIGGWLELDVKVVKRLDFDGRYGVSHMHILQDSAENVYVWTTGSKSLDPDTTHHIKMKVKEHKEYKGVKQTVVWYCKVKEE